MRDSAEKTDLAFRAHSRPRFSSRHTILFALCSAIFFCSQFYRSSNAIIAPQLQKDLGLTPETLGIVSASFFYAYAVTQAPLSLLLDRLGARLIITVLTLVSFLGVCIFAFSDSLLGAMAGRALLGFGLAASLMGGLKLFSEWFSPREFATLSGLLVGAGTLGNLAASTPLALLVEQIGWRYSFVISGVATAVLAILFWTAVRDRPDSHPRSHPDSNTQLNLAEAVKLLLLNKNYWLISCGTFFRYGALMAIQGLWAGPYLMECLKCSPVEAGNIIALSTIGYALGCSAGGWLSDRVFHSRKWVSLLGLAGMGIASLCLTLSWGQSNVVVTAGVFSSLGLFAGFGNVMYAHIKGIMPSRMSGMALTGINFFTMLGVGVYIYTMGWLLERLPVEMQASPEAYRSAFSVTFAGLAVGALLYLFTDESKEFKKQSSATALRGRFSAFRQDRR